MTQKEDRKRKIINKRPLVLPDNVNGITIRNLSRKQSQRKQVLKRFFESYYDKPLYCNAIKAYVAITPQTFEESKYRCCYDRTVTYLNLNIPLVMKHVSFLKKDPAKDNNQQRKMGFIDIFTLVTPIEGMGIARLRIGRTKSKGFTQYTLTRVTLEKFLEKE